MFSLGAAREAREELCAEVTPHALLAVFSVPSIDQVSIDSLFGRNQLLTAAFLSVAGAHLLRCQIQEPPGS